IQSIVAKEAKAQLLEQFKEETPLIAIVYAPEWHEGVIGIVASKLVEEFQIPAIVFTDAAEEGVIKGSARTAGELNIHQELLKNNDLFLKFGGHKAAAGLSLKKENLNQLRKNLSEQLKEIPEIIRMNQVSFDQEIKLSEVSPKLIKELELLEPFGNHNPRPTFKIVDFKLQSFKLLNGGHVKWNFITSDGPQSKAFTIGGISFFFADKWNKLTPEEIYSKSQSGQELAILGQLGFNHFRGNIYMQIMVNDIVERL
ncbi:MAG: DHHA1 domain-containing protein, partial [Bacteriovoracaceae bacterium]